MKRAVADRREEGEAVLLDVGGMKCGGCSAAVKRILSARPEVALLRVICKLAAPQLELVS